MSDHLRHFSRVALLAFFVAGTAHAQYKWVEADGAINYGDRLPPAGARVLATPRGPIASVNADGVALPYALRTAVERYPVTLYTTPSCAPCELGRAHLVKRGIPFSERTITRQADADALRKLGLSGTTLPGLAVGREATDGFESGAWDRLLDAGGYPKTSMLPSGYQRSAANALPEGAVPRGAALTPETLSAAPVDMPRVAPEPAPPTAFANSTGAAFLLPAMPRTEAPATSVRF